MSIQQFPSGTVKGVQRGVANPSSTTAVNITITTVIPAKSHVTVRGYWTEDTSVGMLGVPYCSALTATQLTIATSLAFGSVVGGTVEWQVVEYY
jgi:hypothetical protein